jgi:hypothetical protein
MSDVPNRSARPWDLFNKKIERVTEIIAEERLNICKACPEYIKSTHQCKKCGCIMNLKVKLANANCPIKKWDSVDPQQEIEKYTDEQLGL